MTQSSTSRSSTRERIRSPFELSSPGAKSGEPGRDRAWGGTTVKPFASSDRDGSVRPSSGSNHWRDGDAGRAGRVPDKGARRVAENFFGTVYSLRFRSRDYQSSRPATPRGDQ